MLWPAVSYLKAVADKPELRAARAAGERYVCTYYDDDWLEDHAPDWRPAVEMARWFGWLQAEDHSPSVSSRLNRLATMP